MEKVGLHGLHLLNLLAVICNEKKTDWNNFKTKGFSTSQANDKKLVITVTFNKNHIQWDFI